MAYYQYYQLVHPWQSAWGTAGYQFNPPPMPTYVPQSSWRGIHYHNAHYSGHDSSLFDYVWSKVKSFVTGEGVSRGEAEHWHRRVYGGFVHLHELLPREVGAAAGWETLRLWQTHHSLYASPLFGDIEREREAIISLAIAETARLWQYVGRPFDKYGRREAGEMAAATASRIFMHLYGYDSPYDHYHNRRWVSSHIPYDSPHPRLRRCSSDISDYVGSGYGSIAPSDLTRPAPISVPSAGITYGVTAPYTGYYTGIVASPNFGTINYPASNLYVPQAIGMSPTSVIIHTDDGHHHHGHHTHHCRTRRNSMVC